MKHTTLDGRTLSKYETKTENILFCDLDADDAMYLASLDPLCNGIGAYLPKQKKHREKMVGGGQVTACR